MTMPLIFHELDVCAPPSGSRLQLACLTSSYVFDWLALMLSVGLSTQLLTVNALPVVTASLPNMGKVVVGALAAIQVTFGLMLKLFFFRRL